ncbi:hypothetical protein IQ07DRAFT_583259 [Pyrenochaeta sp. DS3sAY3a]|nr:hypothetical protein IQ07DRAFT_583259 [Pyrenochaeta sp. DS3sAY3a]
MTQGNTRSMKRARRSVTEGQGSAPLSTHSLRIAPLLRLGLFDRSSLAPPHPKHVPSSLTPTTCKGSSQLGQPNNYYQRSSATMSGFQRRRGDSARGLFVEGVWQCDCSPRLPANHFEVKKAGPNKRKWFRTCQKPQTDKSRCSFFLWDTDAHDREAAALANNSRTEPVPAHPVTPSRRQQSPPPPYAIEREAAGSSRKRGRSPIDLDPDDYGVARADASFDNELDQVMKQVETPIKSVKTTSFATPASARRYPPFQMGQPSSTTSDDPFASKALPPKAIPLTPVRVRDDEIHHPVTPSSSLGTLTPTPSKTLSVVAEDLVKDVFSLLQDAGVQLPSHTEIALSNMLSKREKSAEGYKRGREVIRATVKAKDAKIIELNYRINTLEAELEAEKAMVKHLQWEAQDDPSEP